MFELFVLSLVGLCVAAVAAFVVALKNKSWPLALFVPLIALCGSGAYFSYVSVLGYPVETEWNKLPEKITVIYFRIQSKEKITLWLFDKDTTRIVTVPYVKPAEEGLEQGRPKMGKGIPVTYKRGGKGKGNGKGGQGNGKGRGQGQGNGKGRPGNGNGRGGWRYKIESFGEPVPGGKLPPK